MSWGRTESSVALSAMVHAVPLHHNSVRLLCFKIQKQYSRVNCRAFSFANRCMDAWNSLDNDILCASSVQAFKRRLSLHNFSKFLYVL